MSVTNGWLVRGNTILEGKHFEAPWWNGNVKPDYLKTTAKPEYYPLGTGSRTGTGLTDDLNDVADWMQKDNIIVLEHNYGLCGMTAGATTTSAFRRMDGDVYCRCFMSYPFARSGKELAWDGLSKYDLNPNTIPGTGAA